MLEKGLQTSSVAEIILWWTALCVYGAVLSGKRVKRESLRSVFLAARGPQAKSLRYRQRAESLACIKKRSVSSAGSFIRKRGVL